jgi:hypothetical protein
VARIARRIDELRRRRSVADYDLTRSFTGFDAVTDSREARTIVADFQPLLQGIPPPQIVDGARRYLQAIGHIPSTP